VLQLPVIRQAGTVNADAEKALRPAVDAKITA
jgi:hypothetical protein